MRSLMIGTLCLLLILGPVSLGYGQKSGKPKKPRATMAKQPEGVSTSRSGKLKISGLTAALEGILQIQTALTFKGPLLISVSNGSDPVNQVNSDRFGRIVFPLSPGETKYTVKVALKEGNNIIDVMDSDNPDERAALKWVGIRPAGMAEDKPGKPAENGDAPGDGGDKKPPAVKRPTKPRTPPKDDEAQQEKPPEDEQSESSEDPTVRSDSGRLAVLGIHDDTEAKLEVDVGDLKGPFTVTVTNGADEEVVKRTKKLDREETSFVETIPLKTGEYKIKVKSNHKKEAAEAVELGPWTIENPPAEPPEAFSANDFKASEEGHLSAAVTRVNGQGHLKVHIQDLGGFKVKVVALNDTDKDDDDKEVDRRTFSNLDATIHDWSLSVKVGEGENKVVVSSLDEKESVELSVPAEAQLKPADSTPAAQEAVEYDWGRVRGYFTGGMIFSKERDDFSKSDMFLDFTIDKNYVARPFLGIFKDFNTFFNARLTSIPVATAETAENGDGGGEAPEPCNTPDCEGFITSKKAALMQAGIYLPMYWDFTTWFRRVVRQNRTSRWEKNALFIAPLAKGGIMTITGDRETSEGQQFGGDDVFNFYSFGLMMGHSRLHARRKRDGYGNYLSNQFGRPRYEANPNIAPEMISWLTISAGRWENFEILVPTGQKNAAGEEIKVRQRPWRVEALGRLKIPETPFIIGFDGNFGKGPDDVRFIFGTRFDIGKLMRTLKLAGQQDNLGQSGAPNTPAPQ